MVDFVRPNYLGTKAEFSNMFERPIMNGQCIDSTREDVKLMRFRAHVLHSLLEGFVQRRGHDVFFSSLPKKQEYVVLLKLSSILHKQANVFVPLMFIAQEPQMPSRHERLNVRLGSCSFFILIKASKTIIPDLEKQKNIEIIS